MKKFFSIILILSMLLSIIPVTSAVFAAVADQEITSVEIVGVKEPVAGEHPNTDFEIVTPGLIRNDGSYWWNRAEDRELGEDEVFEAGKEYAFIAKIKCAVGYKWLEKFSETWNTFIYEEIPATINGKSAEVASTFTNDVKGRSAKIIFTCPENNTAEEDFEFSITFLKTVEASGSEQPGDKTFEFNVEAVGSAVAATPKFTVAQNTVDTEGVGEYDGEILITCKASDADLLARNGFIITEKNDGAPGWQYDAGSWLVTFEMDPAGGYYAKCVNQNAPEGTAPDWLVEFTNVYGKVTIPSNNPTDENLKVETDPKTGESWFSVCLSKNFVVSEEALAEMPDDYEKEFKFEVYNFPDEIQKLFPKTVSVTYKKGDKHVDFEAESEHISGEIDFELLMAFFDAKNKVKEVNDGDPMWKYDDTVFTRGDGKYVFTNTYVGEQKPGIYVDEENGTTLSIMAFTKKVEKAPGTMIDPPKKTFEFEFFDLPKELPFPEKVTVETDGEGIYEKWVASEFFPEANVGALEEKTFKIREVAKDETGWIYDETVWGIRIHNTYFYMYNLTEGEDMSELADERIIYSAGDVVFTNTFTTNKKDNEQEDENKEYTLTYDPNEGVLSDNIETHPENEKVNLNKVPSRDGHTFTGWYLDKEGTNPITEVTMTSDITVYARWETTPVPEILNGDEHNYYVLGYEDGTVRPEANITRAEVTMIFYRLLKSEVRDANKTTENVFTDVPYSEWYNEAVSTMAKIGIIKGRTPTEFAPDEPITRAEYSAICARFDKSVAEGISTFTDIAGHWAEKDINRAFILGWIKGYNDGTFKPDNNITRAEAMTLTNRVLQRIPEDTSDLLPGMVTFPDCLESDWFYIPVQEAVNSHEYEKKENGYEKWTALK